MKYLIAGLLFCSLSVAARAADDPSIQGATRIGVQKAMMEHIEQTLMDERYVIYDAVAGKLLRLRFDQLHKGIVKKGPFYVSCADFVAGDMRYDLDFLVAPRPQGGYRVLQALVHAAAGKKRPYHLEETAQ